MRLHEAGKPRLAGGVERAGRLVEEPDRPFDGEEPRDRKTPALAGRLFGDSQFGIAAVEPKPPAPWSNKAADDPQQRRFPRAIAAGHGQSLTAFQPKADAGEDLPAAAAAG